MSKLRDTLDGQELLDRFKEVHGEDCVRMDLASAVAQRLLEGRVPMQV